MSRKQGCEHQEGMKGCVAWCCRLHQLTKHRVFTGPGFQVAVELGEAANGGQVLLSHDAWLRLQDRMHEASFPVVQQLGSYKLNAWPVPMPVYQARTLSHLAPKQSSLCFR